MGFLSGLAGLGHRMNFKLPCPVPGFEFIVLDRDDRVREILENQLFRRACHGLEGWGCVRLWLTAFGRRLRCGGHVAELNLLQLLKAQPELLDPIQWRGKLDVLHVRAFDAGRRQQLAIECFSAQLPLALRVIGAALLLGRDNHVPGRSLTDQRDGIPLRLKRALEIRRHRDPGVLPRAGISQRDVDERRQLVARTHDLRATEPVRARGGIGLIAQMVALQASRQRLTRGVGQRQPAIQLRLRPVVSKPEVQNAGTFAVGGVLQVDEGGQMPGELLFLFKGIDRRAVGMPRLDVGGVVAEQRRQVLVLPGEVTELRCLLVSLHQLVADLHAAEAARLRFRHAQHMQDAGFVIAAKSIDTRRNACFREAPAGTFARVRLRKLLLQS